MNYQKLILVGNATDDAQRRTSKKGDVRFTTLDLAVSDARNQTTYFPVVVFGDQGGPVAEYVSKGRQVLVEGRIEVSGKGRFNVIADQVWIGPQPAAKSETK